MDYRVAMEANTYLRSFYVKLNIQPNLDTDFFEKKTIIKSYLQLTIGQKMIITILKEIKVYQV